MKFLKEERNASRESDSNPADDSLNIKESKQENILSDQELELQNKIKNLQQQIKDSDSKSANRPREPEMAPKEMLSKVESYTKMSMISSS